VTVVGSFLILGMADGTMQRVSLAAFILAMGMLVDNAIVIVDGILIDLKLGKPRREAMTAIGRKTAMPLLGATLIAILSFLPIFLSPDTAGVYVRDLFDRAGRVAAADTCWRWCMCRSWPTHGSVSLLLRPAARRSTTVLSTAGCVRRSASACGIAGRRSPWRSCWWG